MLVGTLLMFSSSVFATKTFHVGNGAEPSTIDPHFAGGDWESNIVGDMFMGLITESADGKLIAGLAERWEISQDGKTYTFKIRDAKWSDGEKITANDFEFSFKRALNPKTASKFSFILYPIKNAESVNRGDSGLSSLGVKALNDSTLKITLEDTTPYFLELLTHYTSFAVPSHTVKKHGKEWTKKENIVVSGAFKLEEWKPQTSLTVAKNQNFWDAKNVKLDKVIFYPIEDTSSELKRYSAGELHITMRIPKGAYSRLKKDFGAELHSSPLLGIYYYPINTQKITDIRIRKALSLAINRDVITQKITAGGELPAYAFVPPGTNNYDVKQPQLSFAKATYNDNVAQAKELMKQAGYSKSNPFEFELKYNTQKGHKKVAIAIASMWKQIGVNATLFNQESKVHYNDLMSDNFEVGRAGWVGTYNDPTTFTDLFLENPYNYSRWIDKGVSANAKKASKTVDLKKRAKILAQVEKEILEGHATIPIYYYVINRLVSDKVIGWEDNLLNIHRSRWLDLK